MNIQVMWFRLRLFMFRWVQDNEGDIGLEFFRLITFIKYKECTLIYIGKNFEPAPKYVRG